MKQSKKNDINTSEALSQDPDIDINIQDSDGKTAVIVAAEKGRFYFTATLAGRGADIYHKDKAGKNALEYAQQTMSNDELEFITTTSERYKKKADENGLKLIQIIKQINLLRENGRDGGPQIKKAHDFLKENLKEINVNAQDDEGNSPLMAAAYASNLELVQELLKARANPHLVNKAGEDALVRAVKAPYVPRLASDIGIYLIEKYPDLIKKNPQAIMVAASYGNMELVTALLKAGADLSVKDPIRGNSLLLIANPLNRIAILNSITDATKKKDLINMADNRGNTILMQAARDDAGSFIDGLLKDGAHIDAQNEDDDTALMIAAQRGRPWAARKLVELGADTKRIKNKEGKTALDLLQASGNVSVRDLAEKIKATSALAALIVEQELSNLYTALNTLAQTMKA